MQKEHDVPMVGHCGERTTRATIVKRFYWFEMKQNVEHFVDTCVKCQDTKSITKRNMGYKVI
jgi:hypothetical protein